MLFHPCAIMSLCFPVVKVYPRHIFWGSVCLLSLAVHWYFQLLYTQHGHHSSCRVDQCSTSAQCFGSGWANGQKYQTDRNIKDWLLLLVWATPSQNLSLSATMFLLLIFAPGTFITEWNDGAVTCEAFLKDEESYQAVADRLVKICSCYGFDGWLINIENALSVSHSLLTFSSRWDRPLLTSWIYCHFIFVRMLAGEGGAEHTFVPAIPDSADARASARQPGPVVWQRHAEGTAAVAEWTQPIKQVDKWTYHRRWLD